MTDYTGFSGDPDLQEGNYIALKADSVEGATITVELVGGESGPVTLDEDKNVVIRVTSTTQSIRFIATKDDESITKTYALTNLVLEEEE